jgi:hypothetical protein
MHEALLALLLTLAPWHGDIETDVARQARLSTIATSIAEASLNPRWKGSSEDLAIILVMTAHRESHLALHIHQGRCGQHPKSRKGECDGGKAGTLWQIQFGAWFPKKHWEKLIGTSPAATTAAAKKAADIMALGRNYCRSTEGAIALYAKGSCKWRGSKARYREFMKLREKYRVIRKD